MTSEAVADAAARDGGSSPHHRDDGCPRRGQGHPGRASGRGAGAAPRLDRRALPGACARAIRRSAEKVRELHGVRRARPRRHRGRHGRRPPRPGRTPRTASSSTASRAPWPRPRRSTRCSPGPARPSTAAPYIEVPQELLLARLTGRRICTVDDQHVYHVVGMPPERSRASATSTAPSCTSARTTAPRPCRTASTSSCRRCSRSSTTTPTTRSSSRSAATSRLRTVTAELLRVIGTRAAA